MCYMPLAIELLLYADKNNIFENIGYLLKLYYSVIIGTVDLTIFLFCYIFSLELCIAVDVNYLTFYNICILRL